MSASLDQARAAEYDVRARLADAVAERARATKEADRLDGRAALAGADEAVSIAAAAQRTLAEHAAEKIESLRADLRRAEAEVATLEAALDAERAAQDR